VYRHLVNEIENRRANSLGMH